jgi:hypothetical protein
LDEWHGLASRRFLSAKDRPMICRYGGDPLPGDAPPEITNCRAYTYWLARQRGDTLRADEADALTLWEGLCGLGVTLRDGLEMLPERD